MAYENSNPNVNIVRPNTTQIPQAGNGRFAQQDAAAHTQLAEAPVKRAVPPLTKYNKETGQVENMSDMGALEQMQAPPKEQTQEETDRFSKWKEEQAAKKAEREAAKLDRETKEQELGASLLRKGDIVAAAKAFGMSVPDLITFVNNGALGIKPEPEAAPKPLSLEEKVEKLEKEKAEYQAERKQWEFNLESNAWIKDNITPEFSNKEKYSLLSKLDSNKVQRAVYDFMNQHYQETKEVLSVADILESMENEIYQDQEKKLLELKNEKKFSKFFAAEQAKEEVSNIDPEDKRDIDPWAKQKTPDVKPYKRPQERDLELSQEKPMVLNANEVKATGKNKNAFNLSRAERIALARLEEEEEKNKRK